jgi:aspartyl-tRNA(Asn)/glutamyl-tRNA(Gln) amidotransferase subunit B
MPVAVPAAERARLRDGLPELPFPRRDRLVRELGIPAYDAGVLTQSRALADWFERLARISGDAKVASNWTMGEVLRVLRESGRTIDTFPVTPEGLAELLALVRDGTVSGGTAKKVFTKMIDTGRAARAIVEEEGLAQISDAAALGAVVDGVIAEHPEQVAAFRAGKEKLLGFLMGQAMRATRGQANPKLVEAMLRERLRDGGAS